MDKALPYHKELRELLEDLAALSTELGPVELKALWFDTYYWPCQTYVPPESQAAWSARFSQRELDAMRDFHEVFKRVRDRLPGFETEWQTSGAWREVATAAKHALQGFAPDA